MAMSSSTTAPPGAPLAAGNAAKTPMTREEKKVILASSLGTIFEWYDFYLYGSLAAIIGAQFFSNYPEATRNVFALLAFAAGFLVRPFGALVFGRLGDLVGRKHTFLITIVIMGLSTFIVGCLPGYEVLGWVAPVALIALRMLQGLALGGEYGGAATYVAEHAPKGRRGFFTAWIQTTATLGLLLSLIVILFTQIYVNANYPEVEVLIGGVQTKVTAFAAWGWRIPFLGSVLLLAVSVYIRLKLEESPVFQRMKAEGKGSTSPLRDSFLKYPNNKVVLLALLGATAGQGVVWYTGQFYALFFLTITLKVDYLTAYTLIGASLLIATPFFVFFGWLSDRIGRLRIIMAGCLLAALTYFPIFGALTRTVNPALADYQARTTITVAASDCEFHIFILPGTRFTECDRAKDFLTKSGLSFESKPAVGDAAVVTSIGDTVIQGWDEAKVRQALQATGYPPAADRDRIDYAATLALLVVLVLYVTMVYGPIAAFLVELFPTRIRYTSMSLPYHIGNGWFGGMLPLLATAMVAASGNIYAGLWYPVGVALMSLVIGTLFLRETKDRRIADHG